MRTKSNAVRDSAKRRARNLIKRLLPIQLQRILKRYLERLLVFNPKPISARIEVSPARLERRRGLKALCVSHVLPYPPRAGVEYRVHRLWSWLADQGWDLLVVICPHPGRMPSAQDLSDLVSVYPNVIVCDRDGTLHYNMSDGGQLLKSLRPAWKKSIWRKLGETGGEDTQTQLLCKIRTFCPDALVELLLQLQRYYRPNLLLAEFVFMARPFKLMGSDITKIIDTHDIFSNRPNMPDQLSATDGWALSKQEESALLRRADIIVGIQPEETYDLARLAPDRKVVSAGVDFPVREPDAALRPKAVVLLVAYNNPMNVKGLHEFLSLCWPIIRQQVWDAEFWIVGTVGTSIETPEDRVRVLGPVDDLRPLYAQARVVINPAIAGTGRALKIKTVEALGHLRPVVCWPSGADGVVPEGRRFCHIVTDWTAFAERVARLVGSDEVVLAMEASREKLRGAFSPEAVYSELDGVLRALGKFVWANQATV